LHAGMVFAIILSIYSYSVSEVLHARAPEFFGDSTNEDSAAIPQFG
jgi:hypothetical protein